jgi:hypothetical protein
MAKLILSGSTSGSISLESPAVSGTTTLTLPTTSGTIVTTNTMPAGSVLQVVNATYSTITATSNTTYVDTGLSANITPSSSSSKILVVVHQSECVNSSANVGIKLKIQRNGTDIITIAPAAGYGISNANATISTMYLDSPATTSAITYKTQFGLTSATGTATVQNDSATSTITLMEIKG